MVGFVDSFNSQFDDEIMDELGDELTFINSLNASSTIIGVFSNEYYPGASESGLSVASSMPMVECLEHDVPNASGGQIIHHGTTYAIVGEPEPDGTGMVVLRLRKS